MTSTDRCTFDSTQTVKKGASKDRVNDILSKDSRTEYILYRRPCGSRDNRFPTSDYHPAWWRGSPN